MSLFSDLFSKAKKKGKVDVQITKLPTTSELKAQPEKDATDVRLPPAEQPSPGAKEKPWTAKKIPVWQPGDVILEHYEIEDVITSGGMGRIYIANHRNWKIKVAIKSPTEKMLKDREFFSSVQKEAEAWTELGLHPNIAYCYFVRNIEDIPHIFVEYVDGGNLKQWIEDGRCADLKTGLDLAIQFCHGMAHAHSKGMIHRDIKPANILMTKDGTLKVTDFGIAKWIRVDESGGLHERSGDDLGGMTLPYASPEQFMDEYNVGFETDIFSFGLCLWEMLCGTKPYQIAAVKEKIPDPRKLRPDLPESLHNLLEQFVAFEKEERQKLGGLEALRERFKSIYQELFNEPSPHSELEKIDLRANGLNNRGVSYLELGRKEDAKRCWNDALSIDPKHLEATFNLGYFRWHDGEPYWDTIENPMANLKITYESNPNYWLSLAWVHLDRGEVEAIDDIQGSNHRVEDAAFLRAWEDPKKPVVRLVKTFEGHADQIYSVVFSPDGRHALSSGCDKTVRLWEIETGRTVRQFDGHTNPVSSIAFSPDGRYILSGADRLILWEVATGRQLREWEGTKIGMLHVVSATFSPDGRHILSCWGNYTDFIPNLYVWDVETGDEVARVKGMESGKHLAFSPEGKYVFTGGNARRIQRWLVETGEEVTSFDIYFVSNFALSPCGTYLLTAHPPLGGGGLHLRDTKSGMELKTFYGHTDTVSTVAFSPDGRFVVSGSSDNTLRLWETKTGREIKKFTHANSIYSVAFSPHGAYILSCSGKSLHLYQVFLPHSDGQKKIYERLLLCTVKPTIQVTSEQKRVRMLIESARDLAQGSSFPQAYRCLRQAQMVPGFERDGELLENLVRCGIKGSAKRSGLRGYWHRGILKRYKWLSCVAFSPDSRFVLTGGGEQKLVLWDVETGKTKEFDDYIGYVNSVAFSPDGYYALSGSDSLRLRLWGVETGKEVRHFQCVNGSPRPVAFSPDGCRVYCIDGSRFSDSKEYVVIVLDVTSGQELQRLGVGMILCGAFSYDARTVALGYHDGITLLDLDSGGSELDRLTWKDGELSCIAMSADGHHVAFGSYGKTAVIWNVKTGNITNFEGVEGSVHSVAFSPDGNYLLVSSGREVILLNIMTGLEWARFRGHTAEVNSAIFSPNGRYMVSASSDENLRLHELDWEWEFPEGNEIDNGGTSS